MSPSLIDTHSHLHFRSYDADRDAVLERMREQAVRTITVGTNIATSRGAVRLAERASGVFAAVGYHPGNLTSSHEDGEQEIDAEHYSAAAIRRIAESSKRVVAIGEIGLDYAAIDPERDGKEAMRVQADAFLEQMSLAFDLNLPVIIHCRDAFDDLIAILKNMHATARPRAVVHCFTQPWELAERLLDLGLFLSFTGNITFKPRKSDDPAAHVHRVIERMPLNRIMIETDAPWLAPVPHRGKRNEPVFVKYVADKIAELRNVPPEEIAKATTENAMGFFSLSDA
jgi:TatD DNase family protein